jgi:hypothetical protein
MCKCVLPPGVNPVAVDKYIKLSTSWNTVLGGKLHGLICKRWSELHPVTCHKGLVTGGWSTPRTKPQYAGKDTVPIVQEAGWAPGPVWTVMGNLDPTGMRSPDSPSRSVSMYRGHHPGPIQDMEMLHEILTTVETQVFCSTTLCDWSDRYRCFGESNWLLSSWWTLKMKTLACFETSETTLPHTGSDVV